MSPAPATAAGAGALQPLLKPRSIAQENGENEP
jgi:hypothetical protein